MIEYHREREREREREKGIGKMGLSIEHFSILRYIRPLGKLRCP